MERRCPTPTNPARFHVTGSLNDAAVTTLIEATFNDVRGDFNHDGHVDGTDFTHFHECGTHANVPQADEPCKDADLDGDGDVDMSDFGLFQRCYRGPCWSKTQAPPRSS